MSERSVFWERYRDELEQDLRRARAQEHHLRMALATARQFDPQPYIEFSHELATLLYYATRNRCHACAMPEGKHEENCLIPQALEVARIMGWSSGEDE